MLFVFGGLAIFVLGGLTGVMVALVPFDFQAHDTFFVVGHLHYVLIGGALFPILAGCYYFFPLINGKQLSDRLGKIAFWLTFIGFNVAFLPMHLTGLRGMPRRVFTYPAGLGFDALNLVSSIGAFILAAGLAVVVWDLVRPKGKQPLRGAQSVGRRHAGVARRRCPASRGASAPSRRSTAAIRCGTSRTSCGTWTRAGSTCPTPRRESGKRWSPASSTRSRIQCLRAAGADLHHVLRRAVHRRLLHLRHVPLVVAGGDQRACWRSARSSYWLWTGTAFIPEKEEKDVGLGLTLPLYASGPASVGWWAMFITMLGDVTAFVSPGVRLLLLLDDPRRLSARSRARARACSGPRSAAVLLLGAWALTLLARRWNRRDRAVGFYVGLLCAAALAVAGGGALLAGPWFTGLDPTSHVYPATVWVLVIWTAVHVARRA